MPPLSTGELIAGLVGAAVTRAFLVGCAVWLAMLLWPGVSVGIREPLSLLWFGLMGALMLSFLGLMTSIWADKFDHAAAVTNFVVAPLSLLSGTFYSVEQLSPAFRAVSHANPFFYVISGFRYGFLGVTDSPLGRRVRLAAAQHHPVGRLLRAPEERLEDQELDEFGFSKGHIQKGFRPHPSNNKATMPFTEMITIVAIVAAMVLAAIHVLPLIGIAIMHRRSARPSTATRPAHATP